LRARPVRCAALLGTLLAAALLLVACGGGSAGDGSALPSRAVGPETFAAALVEPDRISLNVHVPDEGSIAGTDLSIPFDELEARQGELPDPSTPLALYCRSGNMSATVDFPDPELPTSATVSPAATVRSKSRSTGSVDV